MSVVGGWVLAPLVLGLLVCGLGLLAEHAAGREAVGSPPGESRRLPGALVPAVGLGALIAVAGIPTLWDATAELSLPLVSGLAAAGLVLARPWRDPRLRALWPWPLAVAAGAYAIFAAPSLLSGQGSIAGYVKLDDSAIWLALTEHVLSSGRDLSGLPTGSHQVTLQTWLGTEYPVGSFLPLGICAALSGQDPAGAYQAVIAVYAAIAALGLFAVVGPFAGSPARSAGVALVAVQASLFLGYTQWGGIKEAAIVALLAPLAYLATSGPPALLCVVAGAVTGVMGLNGLAWAGPALLIAALRRPPRRTAGVAAAVLALAALPALVTVDFLRQTSGVLSAGTELGNLARPLSLLQGLGLWPAGDFRIDPDPRWAAVLLALAGAAGAAVATWLAVRRRQWPLAALVGITAAGVVPALVVGSPWVDAKALAILSPVVLAAAAGAGACAPAPAALAAGAVLAFGSAWSSLAVVRDVYVAPRARLAELREVGQLTAGLGPLLQLDFDIYGDRYFLRDAAPEGATDLRSRPVNRAAGGLFAERTTAEVDDVAVADLWLYRTIVRRRSPVASRPPAAFRRIHAGAAWEAWTRAPGAAQPLARLPLGTPLQPAAVPDCGRVRELARTPGIRALAAVPRRAPYVAAIADVARTVPFSVPSRERWRVWVGGSSPARLAVTVDHRGAGAKRHELAHAGQWMRFAAVPLAAGDHSVRLDYDRGGILRAGRGTSAPALGPVAITAPEDDGALRVLELAPRRARELCDGRAYDWIEALG